VLALRGGAELVALCAQLGSVMELVWGAALAGVGTGVAVLAAQHPDLAARRALLSEALRVGLAVSAAVMLAGFVCAALIPGTLLGDRAWQLLLALAAMVGWVAVIGGVVNGYWMGTRESGKMLALSACGALAPLTAAVLAPTADLLLAVTLAHGVPAILLTPFLPWRRARGGPRREPRLLRQYLLPGLSIGILSPLSMLAARAVVSAEISLEGAGILQAMWRATDWVGSIASGVLAIHFLPRLSAAAGTPGFRSEMRRAALAIVLPSALAYGAFFFFQREIFAWLYDPAFVVPDAAAAIFLAGCTARVAAWVPLFALYATRRTWAIAVGELLSLPLFVALLALWPAALTLGAASLAWLIAFVGYAIFNAAALAAAGVPNRMPSS
jgi:hypothetical protein